MKNYKYFAFLFLVAIFSIGFIFLNVSDVQAEATMPKVVLKYPISELGNCQSKNACKEYCNISSHYISCTDFGEKNKLIPKEEATLVKKPAEISKGPGACASKESCDLFCNKKENRKECFNFAKDRGFVTAEKIKEMEEGVTGLFSELDKLPPLTSSCLKDNLGEETINKIKSDNFTPWFDVVDIVKECFEKILPQLQVELDKGLQQAPPAAQNCFKSIFSKVSEKTKTGGFKGMSDFAEIFKDCLPAGTKVPSGNWLNMESLKKIEEFYGGSLSPKDLESLKKVEEQLKGVIPDKNPDVSGNLPNFNLEDLKKIQDKMKEEYNKLTPEQLEQIKKMQEQGQFENATPVEIEGRGTGGGMGL